MRNILFILFVLISVVCNAQHKVKEYTIEFSYTPTEVEIRKAIGNLIVVDTEKEKIEIFHNYNELKNIDIVISKDSVIVNDKYYYSLNKIKDDLIYTKKKYDEWSKIVKKEKLNDIVKPIINNTDYCILFYNNYYKLNRVSILFGDYTNITKIPMLDILMNTEVFNKLIDCIFNFDEIIQKEKDKMAEAIEKSREKEYKLSLLK